MDVLNINVENLTPQQMVDLCGVLATQEKLIAERRKVVSDMLINMQALPLSGNTFKAQIVEATTQWHLNKETITLEMGQDWVTKHSKSSLRAAYVLVKPLPMIATALKGIAA